MGKTPLLKTFRPSTYSLDNYNFDNLILLLYLPEMYSFWIKIKHRYNHLGETRHFIVNKENRPLQLSPEEQFLLDACLQNNRKQQQALYEKYKDAMYTIACRMLKDSDLACDALQDGFIQVFRGLRSFKGQSTLGAWIKTIIVRACINKLKKEIEQESIPENYNYETIEWDDNLTGEELEKAIEKLPSGYRSVFLLIEVEGYSHKEVAQMLNIAEGTSKSQLYHSKQMLQKLLRDLRN